MLIFGVGSLLYYSPLHSQVVYQLDRVNAPATATFILFGVFFGGVCSFRCRLSRVTEGDQSDKKAEEEAVLDILFTIHGRSLGIL